MKTFAVSYALPENPEPEKVSINWPKVLFWLLVVVFLASVVFKTLGQENAAEWLFGPNGAAGGGTNKEIAIALGPILALALAIERLIETVFDIFESNMAQVAKMGAAGGDGFKYIQEITTLYNKEMNNAKTALEDVIKKPNPTKAELAAKPGLITALEEAEKRLRETGTLWENLPKDPKYTSWKRALSIWFGLIIGMVVAVFSDHGFFYYLDIKVPQLLDMFITGFVIGAGSGPLHSLVGILQGAKDTLSNLGNFTGLAGVKDELRSLRAKMEGQ